MWVGKQQCGEKVSVAGRQVQQQSESSDRYMIDGWMEE